MFTQNILSADKSIQPTDQRNKPLTNQTQRLLGLTVCLSQLPLILHLPFWLTLPGMALVLAKTFTKPQVKIALPPTLTIIFVLIAAIAVFFHYGHLFGRDPCVAFLFLLLGFKFVETKRPFDASLLIILCAFLLLTQFFFQQSLLAAIVSIPAMYFIGLSLFALQRGSAKTDSQTMVHITAKLFLQAMPIAALLFVAVPRIAQAPLNGNGNGDGQAQTGLSARMSPGSIASLSKSSEVAFRVEFENSPPDASQRYWRGPVLTGFDGHDWFVLPSYELLPTRSTANGITEHGIAVKGRTVEYTVTQPASYHPWLLALDTPSVTPEALNNDKLHISVNQELQVETATLVNQPLRYRGTSILSDRFKPSTAPTNANLVTTSTNPKTRALVLNWRQQYSDDATFANKILHWFNSEPFHYTLNPPTLGKNSIDDFIFNTRRGFCEHYAGSFVFMLRAAGIPARVVTGYQGGEMNAGYMIVRQSDAHAWAEAYIAGEWIRYDPTAAVAPQRVEQGANDALRNDMSRGFFERTDFPLLNSAALKWDKINFAWQKMIIDFDASNQQAIWKKLGINKPSGLLVVLALMIATALWAAIILKPFSELTRKKLQPCEKHWRHVCKKLAAHGLDKKSGETHSLYIERACKQWPSYEQPLQTIIASYHNGMYAPQGADPQQHLKMAGQMKAALKKIKRLK